MDYTKVNFLLYTTAQSKPLEDVLVKSGFQLMHDPVADRLSRGEQVFDYSPRAGSLAGSLIVRHQNPVYFQREVLSPSVDTALAAIGLVPPNDFIAQFYRDGKPDVPREHWISLAQEISHSGYDVGVFTGHAPYATGITNGMIYATTMVKELMADVGLQVMSTSK